MQEFSIYFSDKETLVVAESAEKCHQAICNVLMNRYEEICILKKTYEGNTHDENWQNRLYVLNGEAWADKLDSISNDRTYGWFFDPPIVDNVDRLEDCISEWAKYNCDGDSREIYTAQFRKGKILRRKYSLIEKLPESTAIRNQKGNRIREDTSIWEKVVCWIIVLVEEEECCK